MNKERKVEEPEIVNDMSRMGDKAERAFEDFATKFAEDQFNSVKNQILLQGGLWLFFAGLVFFAVLGIIVWLLSIILPPLFVIFIALFLFGAITYVVMQILNIFRKRK